MKKAIIILMLAIPAALHAAVEWYPSVTLSAGYTGYIAPGTVSDEVWNMASAGAEISLLSMRIDKRHILSLPMEASYTGGSETIGRLKLSGYYMGRISLRYAYMITERIEASLSFDTAFIWHRLQEAGEWRIGGSAGIAWYPEEYIALRLPVSFLWNRGGLSFSAGLGLCIAIGGMI